MSKMKKFIIPVLAFVAGAMFGSSEGGKKQMDKLWGMFKKKTTDSTTAK